MVRAVMSMLPPGANGTTMRMGLSGYAARAGAAIASSATIEIQLKRRGQFHGCKHTRLRSGCAVSHRAAAIAARARSLAGKTIGFIDNSKPNFNYLVDDLSELLVSKHGVAGVIKRRKRSALRRARRKR